MLTVAECRSCGAPIFWVVTEAGRRMPMDARPLVVFTVDESKNPPAAKLLEGTPVYQTHFVSCPNADQHRKKR